MSIMLLERPLPRRFACRIGARITPLRDAQALGQAVPAAVAGIAGDDQAERVLDRAVLRPADQLAHRVQERLQALEPVIDCREEGDALLGADAPLIAEFQPPPRPVL